MVDLSEFEKYRVGAKQESPNDANMGAQQPTKPSTGWRGVGEDVMNLIGDPKNLSPEMVEQGIKNATIGMLDEATEAALRPQRWLPNIFSGAAKLGQAINRAPYKTEKYFREKEILPKTKTFFKDRPEMDFDEYFGVKDEQPGDALLQGFGEMGPFGAIGQGGGIRNFLKRAAAGGAAEGTMGRNPVTGALMSPIGEAPLGAPALIGRLSAPRGALSPFERLERQRAAEGLNVNLGDVIDSPGLKFISDTGLDNVLFGGGDVRKANIRNQVQRLGESQLGGQMRIAPDYANQSFKDLLENSFEQQKSIKNKMYAPVSEMAEQEGLKIDFKNFNKNTQSSIDKLSDSMIAEADPRFKSLINHMQSLKNPEKVKQSSILDPQGKPYTSTVSPSIADAQYAANSLYNKGLELKDAYNATTQDKERGRQYIKMAKDIKKDVKATLKEKGSDELQEAYRAAEKNYRENYSPFLDRNIQKLINPNEPPDLIARKIIKPGLNNYTTIEKVQKLLPPGQENALGYTYLSGAFDKDNKLNVKEMARLIKGLKHEQMKALFPDPKTRQQLLDFGKARGMSEKALSAMANPETGVQVLKDRKFQQLAAAGTLAMAGQPLAAGASIAIPAAAGQTAGRLLSNENFRKAYIDYINKLDLGQETGIDKFSRAMGAANVYQQKGDNE